MLHILLGIFLLVQQGITQGFNYTPNQKYSYVGKVVIDVVSEIQTAGTSNWSTPVEVVIPYPANMKFNSDTNLTAMAVFGDFWYKGFTYRINVITAVYNRTQTSMVVHIYSTLANYFQKLSIFYIFVLKESYYNDFSFYLLQQDNNGVSYDFSNPFLSSTFTIQCTMPAINFTGGATSVAFISGLNVQLASYPGTLQLILQSQVKSSIQVNIKISSPSRTAYLLYILISIAIYNKGFTYSPSFHFHFDNGLISMFNSPSTTYTNNYQMAGINTFIGLSGFKISNQDTFSFFSSVDSSSVSITSQNNFDYLALSFLVVTSYYCDYTKPYFQQISNTCFLSCPATTIANSITLTCICYIDNILVNNSNCYPNTIEQAQKSTSTIIGISIGSFCAIAIVGIIIYKKRSNGREGQDNTNPIQGVESKNQEGKIKNIEKPVQISNSKNIINDAIQQQSSKGILAVQIKQQPPRFYSAKERTVTSQWEIADVPNQSDDICGICFSRRTFFKNQCQHNFHLSCIPKFDKKDRKCPQCKQPIKKGRFYCIICNIRYRIEQVDNNPQKASHETQCDQCKNIPL